MCSFRRVLGKIQLLRYACDAHILYVFRNTPKWIRYRSNYSNVDYVSIWSTYLHVSIPGAWIADRITGTRGATLLGAVLIIIGHICLSLPFALFGLFSSMFFIIIGSGLMKPNISNIVGRLYPENDTRIDAGFVIFYMSVNLGALISPIILQHFVDIRNFHGGFF